jgi:hypothetical protein
MRTTHTNKLYPIHILVIFHFTCTSQILTEVGIVGPAFFEGEVEHGVARVPGHLLRDVQEFRESVLELIPTQRAVGLEEDQALASGGSRG